MRVLIGVVAVLAASVVFPSCGSSSTTAAPSQTAATGVTGVRISVPSTIAPGSTAQLSAMANYTDGSTKDVTATAVWRSSSTSILTISAAGLASAIQSGDVSVTAALGGVQASQPIVVVPTGTFRLTGDVEGFGAQLGGALVQVTSGVGAGLSTVTGPNSGFYRLYGVAGNIEITVSKDQYVPMTRALTVSSNSGSVNFDLVPINPPPNLAGTYSLRITADPSCATAGAGTLPAIGRDRRYTATLAQNQSSLHVVLGGASFLNDSNSFYGSLAAPDLTKATFYLDDYYYYKTFDVAEVLPDNSGNVYLPVGEIAVIRSGADLVGTFNGTIEIKASPSGAFLGQCKSTNHAVTFTNQGGSAARTRSGR
jgi:hypothetical protein